MPNSHLPRIHVGLRTIKTIVVVFLSLCLAYARQGFANPLYISIAAILCIQPTLESSRKAGTNRLIGTLVGGFWGIVVFLVNLYIIPDAHIILKYAFISIALIPMIYTDIMVKRASVVATSAVVYLIITVSPVGNMTSLQFVYNRLLDTFMGFAIAMAVNWVKLPSEAELESKKAAMDKRMKPDREDGSSGAENRKQ